MASFIPAVASKCLVNARLGLSTRSLSSVSSKVLKAPSKFVRGVSVEDIESDPALKAYFEANFPQEEEDGVAEKKAAEEAMAKELDDNGVHKKILITDEQAKLNIRTMFCYERDLETEEGTRQCEKLRDERIIPGVLHGGDPNLGIYGHEESSRLLVKTPWNQLQRELNRYHRSIESRVYDLTVYKDEEDQEGTVHRVMPRDVQYHPVKQTLYCTNYLRYFPGRVIKIPIEYINQEESRAMKAGGFIAPVNRFVDCIVEEGVPIPKAIDLECTGLQLKEVVRMNRLIFPDGVTVSKRLKDPDMFLVGTVFGRRALVGDETEDEAEGETQKAEE